MFVAGTSRRQIARRLNAAYANGLLSEDTFSRRTDQLLAGGMIEPSRLIGDLSFRDRPARLAGAAAMIAGLIGRVTGRAETTDFGGSPALLALDWSGTQTEMLVGRHHGCEVMLSDLSVSRRHARLVFRDGKWILRDLDSTNGTAVNGCPVGRCELRPGDDVAFGDAHLTID